MPRVKKSFYTGNTTPPKKHSTSLSQESGKYRQHSHQPGTIDTQILNSYGRVHSSKEREYRFKISESVVYLVISQCGDIHDRVREIAIGKNINGNFKLFPKIKLSNKFEGHIFHVAELVDVPTDKLLASAQKFCASKKQPDAPDDERPPKPKLVKVLHVPTAGKIKIYR